MTVVNVPPGNLLAGPVGIGGAPGGRTAGLGSGPAPAASAVVAQLWLAYRTSGDGQLRERLILHYAPLVKYVAGRLVASLPSHVETGDLVSYGVFGLIDAVEKFDPAQQVPFEGYARTRIRGAIVDGLRAADWVPRSTRVKARALDRAYGRLQTALSRAPRELELAVELGLTGPQLAEVLSEVAAAQPVSLDALAAGTEGHPGNPVTVGDSLPDPHAADPSTALDTAQVGYQLAAAVRGLPDRQRTVIALYYYENLTFADIGQVLNLTESRVFQLHASAVRALRSRLPPEVR